MRIIVEPTEKENREANPNSMFPSVEVSVPTDSLDIHDFFECLIKPALLASGYSNKTIEDYLNNVETDGE